MLTEDHLIRMINLAISALLRIVGLKQGGEYQDALALIDITFERLLGLRASVAKSLDDERLYYLLTRGDQIDMRRLAIIADLFLHEGDIYTQQGRDAEGQADFARALKYDLEVFFNIPEEKQAEVMGKIDFLLHNLDPAGLGSDVLWPLASFHEEIGDYASAESTLLRLAERPEIRSSIVPELVAFYERLLELPEADLSANGMTHAQIRQKIQRWRGGKAAPR